MFILETNSARAEMFEMVNEAKIINIHVYTRNKFC